MPVKKYFPFFGAVIIICCAWVIHISIVLSDRAAWSLIISSINGSPWELYKPLGLVYIFFTFIELSCIRPFLVHFVSSKVIGMYVLCFSALIIGTILQYMPELFPTQRFLITAAASVFPAQLTAYRLFRSEIRVESFCIPMLVSVLCMIFLLITLSFYPPDMVFFKAQAGILTVHSVQNISGGF